MFPCERNFHIHYCTYITKPSSPERLKIVKLTHLQTGANHPSFTVLLEVAWGEGGGREVGCPAVRRGGH